MGVCLRRNIYPVCPCPSRATVGCVTGGFACRLQALRDNYVPALQRKADSLEADSAHDNQKLEELQAEYALLEHELQVIY